MYNKKIAYYRKKNMVTQEELANQIHVSRQTITKWESGIITPNLESLIDLSNVFNVTLDSLIKDDDCLSLEDDLSDHQQLLEFIIETKRNTYANKSNKQESSRNQSHDYMFENNNFQYYDSFFGSEKFSGQEIVYQNKKICWSMNYYGQVLSHEFRSDFLKQALLHVNQQSPFRGPQFYQKGEYTYISQYNGDITFFEGSENIYYQNKRIYTCRFHGEYIKA